jgi:hypothetical protein
LALERERFVDLFDGADQREGVSAFLEKRKPRWQAAQLQAMESADPMAHAVHSPTETRS